MNRRGRRRCDPVRGRRSLGAVAAVVVLATAGCEDYELSRPADLSPLESMAVGLAVFGVLAVLSAHAVRRIHTDRPRRRLAGSILTTWLVAAAVGAFYECARSERISRLTGGTCDYLPPEVRPRTIVELRCTEGDIAAGAGWGWTLVLLAIFFGLPLAVVLLARWAVLWRWSVLSVALPAALCLVAGFAGLVGAITAAGFGAGEKVLYVLVAVSSIVAGGVLAAEATDPTTTVIAAGYRAAARARPAPPRGRRP